MRNIQPMRFSGRRVASTIPMTGTPRFVTMSAMSPTFQNC